MNTSSVKIYYVKTNTSNGVDVIFHIIDVFPHVRAQQGMKTTGKEGKERNRAIDKEGKTKRSSSRLSRGSLTEDGLAQSPEPSDPPKEVAVSLLPPARGTVKMQFVAKIPR